MAPPRERTEEASTIYYGIHNADEKEQQEKKSQMDLSSSFPSCSLIREESEMEEENGSRGSLQLRKSGISGMKKALFKKLGKWGTLKKSSRIRFT